MRTSFATLLLSAFLGISMLGIFAMNMSNGAHEGCFATAMASALCPDGSNALAMIGFHFDAFQNFSTAIFASSILGLFFLAFVLRYGFLHVSHPSFSPRQVFFPSAEHPLFIREKIRHWLALHENSPGALYGRL